MDYLGYPLDALSASIGHALHERLPEIKYEDRDWDCFYKTKEDKRVQKSRKHTIRDIEIYNMFPQTWGSTSLGFEGIGGCAMCTAYTIILKPLKQNVFLIYFNNRFAYYIDSANDLFFEDVKNRNMKAVKDSIQYYNCPTIG